MSKHTRKEPKVIAQIGNKTILAAYDPNHKNEFRKSVYTPEVRKKLSEKRRSRTKQPRSGQSSKPDDMFSQLLYEYFGVAKKITNETKLVKLVSDIKSGKRKKKGKTKISFEEQLKLLDWLLDNKSILIANDSEHLLQASGIIASYHIQRVNFNERKIPTILFDADDVLATTYELDNSSKLAIDQQDLTDESNNLEYVEYDNNYFPEDVLIAKTDLEQAVLKAYKTNPSKQSKLEEILSKYYEYFDLGILDYSFYSAIEEVIS